MLTGNPARCGAYSGSQSDSIGCGMKPEKRAGTPPQNPTDPRAERATDPDGRRRFSGSIGALDVLRNGVRKKPF
jgi:hypothetical protein